MWFERSSVEDQGCPVPNDLPMKATCFRAEAIGWTGTCVKACLKRKGINHFFVDYTRPHQSSRSYRVSPFIRLIIAFVVMISSPNEIDRLIWIVWVSFRLTFACYRWATNDREDPHQSRRDQREMLSMETNSWCKHRCHRSSLSKMDDLTFHIHIKYDNSIWNDAFIRLHT